MIDAIVQELYVAQVATKAYLETIARALDPDSKKFDLTSVAEFPEAFLKGQYNMVDTFIQDMRSSAHDLEFFYRVEESYRGGYAFELRSNMLEAECDMLGLCDAMVAFYQSRNETIPEGLLDDSRKRATLSEKRISALILNLDEALDDAEEESHEITDQVSERRAVYKTKYLDRMHKGFDARTMHELSLNTLATQYLMVADAYLVEAGLHAATQILRLEHNPSSLKGEEHLSAYDGMKSNLKNAATAIDFAAQASPENAPQTNAQFAPDYGRQKPQ